MLDNLFCEPCLRLTRGEVFGIDEFDSGGTSFTHHDNFASFDEAIHLPCSICTLAWRDVQKPLSTSNWGCGLLGLYRYSRRNNERKFFFFLSGHEGKRGEKSAILALVPWPGPNDVVIPEAMSSNTQSDSALKFILDKYHRCCEEHKRCHPPRQLTPSTYPSRLLDVGTQHQSLIVLRDTGSFREEKYVCLSHCWGYIRPFTLNAKSHFALTNGIDAEALPKTFRDAIFITRLLCIRYIWIDSLCILQDNEDDWASESSRMGDVYAHAACTIAATAARDSSDGLFFERCPQSFLPRCLTFDSDPKATCLEKQSTGLPLQGSYCCDASNLAQRFIEDTPLNKRAWVCQERQLSRRIIHFTSTQLFWECYENIACETYPASLPDHALPFWLWDTTVLKNQLFEVASRRKKDSSILPSSPISTGGLDFETYFAWGVYRYQYSGCALTHNTDKLVAIHGIASRVSKATGDQFIAGVWRNRLVEELCWSKDRLGPVAEPTQWIAPSWSWASSNSLILFSLLTTFHGCHPRRESVADVVEFDVKAKTSGELISTSLKMKCKLLPAVYTPAAALTYPDKDLLGLLELIGQEEGRLELRRSHATGIPGTVFSLDDEEVSKPLSGYVIAMQQCLHENKSERPNGSGSSTSGQEQGGVHMKKELSSIEDMDNVEALFVRMCDEAGERFERVGCLGFTGFSLVDQILKAYRLADDRVITLV